MQSWIQTFTGKMFNIEQPSPDMVCIEDIAHALSNICRFTGHTRRHYSVAQHSVIVAQNANFAKGKTGLLDPLRFLLHDAAEAYLGDVSSPLKRLLPAYKELERLTESAIWIAFGQHDFYTAADLHDRIKEIDLRILVNEKRDLFLHPAANVWNVEREHQPLPIPTIQPLPAEEAERLFLDHFQMYSRVMANEINPN